jgi:hypothetical protein
MALALYIFASTSSLGHRCGRDDASNGVRLAGGCQWSWGVHVQHRLHGPAFGVANFAVLDICQIMLAANNSAVGGEPWGLNLSRRNDGQAVIGVIDGDL